MARRRDIGRAAIVQAAENFLQTHGYQGFSLRDLAEAVGLRAASLLHHFPSKAALACAATRSYREKLNAFFSSLAEEEEALPTRLDRIIWRYHEMERHGKACLLAALSAEFATLPPELQAELRTLASNLHGWLHRFLTEARQVGEIAPSMEIEGCASAMVAALQGGVLLSRVHDSPQCAEIATRWLRSLLG